MLWVILFPRIGPAHLMTALDTNGISISSLDPRSRQDSDSKTLKTLHPGRITWNLQITHLERKMIFQTPMIMFRPLIFQGVSGKPT